MNPPQINQEGLHASPVRPLIDGLWGVRYQVQDVQRSVEFYTNVLGFKLDQQHLPAFGQVSLGNLKLILSGPGASGSRPMPDGRRQEPGGWNRVVLEVKDLPAIVLTLQKRGLRFRNEVEAGPGGRQVQVEDPDGNPLEFFEPGGLAIQEVEQRVAERTIKRDELRRALAAAEEAERRRLARELHDEAGQQLTALGLGLQALSNAVPAGSEASGRAAQLRALADTIARELHALAVRLRPKALDDFGLEAAIAAFTEAWSAQSGVSLDVHAEIAAERLPSEVESAVYRIVQEALANVAKHSQAKRASVVVERRDGNVVAIIEDDGKGFDVSAVERQSAAPGSDGRAMLGLLGIRERAALLGGSVEVECTPGRGTTLFVRIPVATASRGRARAGEG